MVSCLAVTLSATDLGTDLLGADHPCTETQAPIDTDTILEVVEKAARGLKETYDPEDEHDAHCIECFDRVASTANYWFAKSCSSTWNPVFINRLKTSVAVSFPKLDEQEKECVRAGTGKCMACGRNEEKNYTAISFFGNKSEAAFKDINKLSDDYEVLRERFNGFYDFEESVSRTHEWEGKKKMFHEDGGTFVIGETCLTRAKLAFMSSTFISDMCYNVDVHMNERISNKERVSNNMMYCNQDEDHKLFNDSYDAMMRLCSRETEWLDEKCIPVDAQYWKFVRLVRSRAFKDRMELLYAMGARARDETLGRRCEAAWKKCMEHEYNMEMALELSKERGLAKSRVVEDSSDEEDEDEEIPVSRKRRAPHALGKARQAPAKRVAVAVAEDHAVSAASSSNAARTPSTPEAAPAGRGAPSMSDNLIKVKNFLMQKGESELAVFVLEAAMALNNGQ
jgi:hypothetical protein